MTAQRSVGHPPATEPPLYEHSRGTGEGSSSAATIDLQQREEHRVIADLIGKGGYVRTLPIPTRVKDAVDCWLTAAGISTGPIFRAINKARRVATHGFSPKVIWVS